MLLSCLIMSQVFGANLALENINKQTQGAIGYGWDGFECKTYGNNAFMQYTLAMFAYTEQVNSYNYGSDDYTASTKGEHHFALGVYRGHYLYKKPHTKDKMDTAVKIRYGGKVGAVSEEYNFSFSNHKGLYANLSAGLGVELLSPLSKGLGVEIYIEQELSVDQSLQYLIAPGLYFSAFFNY